ncbi:MAG: type II secretion system inner membrane protein GspF [Gammaproteobacteria bacterium]|jgi:general secretion pathway protein F|nr:type II secretion system inner membrane protein GspF [Gammaproteobacteria bacterium]
MGAYEYTALDNRGREKKGVIEGDTPRQIRQILRERGLAPLTVSEIARQDREPGRRWYLRRPSGASPGDISLVTRQFATLVRAGLPIEEALSAVAEQSEKARIKSMVFAIRARIMEGQSLARALGTFPRAFPDLYRATVAAGEQSGHLDTVLDRLADYTEGRQALRQNVMLALLYPVLVIIVAILVVTLLLAYVVPQVVTVFADMGQELPALTRMLIASSDFVREWGLLLLLLAVAGFVAARLLLRRYGPRRAWHAFLLRLPLVSRLLRGMNAARFARTLSILAESGVPVLEALGIAAEVIIHLPMREAVTSASRQVREGASLNRALARSGYFPPLTVHLIASGEASGRLEAMLERAAISQERELETVVKTVVGLFGPFLILIMGGIVLLIVLAILLPIFNLNQLVL